jgi:histidinol-phosphate aminotransferase
VHPQFTEPEAALRSAGHAVDRVVLDWPYTLDPARIPADADLVVIGNPTNPTSVLHPAATLATLARPRRTLVVDEAFADCIPGEPESLAGQRVPRLVVLRSLTKTWGLAGLRCGYLLAPPDLVATLAAAQPLWPVSTPALVACIACSRPAAIGEADAWALRLTDDRSALMTELGRHDVAVVPDPAASFVLFRHQSDDAVRERLAGKGFAVRRGDTFPGLGPAWLRVAVRDPETTAAFGAALGAVL